MPLIFTLSIILYYNLYIKDKTIRKERRAKEKRRKNKIAFVPVQYFKNKIQ